MKIAYAASQKPISLLSLCRAMLGMQVEPAAYMSGRERIDYAIVTCIFGVLVASYVLFMHVRNNCRFNLLTHPLHSSNGFAILSAQILVSFGSDYARCVSCSRRFLATCGIFVRPKRFPGRLHASNWHGGRHYFCSVI